MNEHSKNRSGEIRRQLLWLAFHLLWTTGSFGQVRYHDSSVGTETSAGQRVRIDQSFWGLIGDADRFLLSTNTIEWGTGSATMGLNLQLATNRIVLGRQKALGVITLANLSTNDVQLSSGSGAHFGFFGWGAANNRLPETGLNRAYADPLFAPSRRTTALSKDQRIVFGVELERYLEFESPGVYYINCRRKALDPSGREVELTSNTVRLELVAHSDPEPTRPPGETPARATRVEETEGLIDESARSDGEPVTAPHEADAAQERLTADDGGVEEGTEGVSTGKDRRGLISKKIPGYRNPHESFRHPFTWSFLATVGFLLASLVGVVWLIKRR